MATIAGRNQACIDAVESVIDDLDRLYLSCNGQPESFRAVADHFDQDERVRINYATQGTVWGALQDAAKFRCWNLVPGYFFALDDDLIYADGYIDFLIEGIERYGRYAAITLHGRRFDSPIITNYYRSATTRFYCTHRQANDGQAHVGGTGVMGFWNETVELRPETWTHPCMADIWVARDLQASGVPTVVIAHEAGIVRLAKGIKDEDTIYGWHRDDCQIQTDLIRLMKRQPWPKLPNTLSVSPQ